MRNKLLKISVLFSLAIFFLSFTNIKSEKPKSCKDCSLYVSVFAQGLTVNHVTLSVGGGQVISVQTNITPGTTQYFTNPAFVQGASINCAVNILGAGGAPRMNSLGVGDLCNQYTNVTQGNITGVQGCTGLGFAANHLTVCP
jgi:hypothetical protein